MVNEELLRKTKMMRKIFIVVCMCLLALHVDAQRPKGTFSLVPRVGACIANLSNNEVVVLSGSNGNETVIKSKYNPRFAGGLDLEYQAFPLTSFSVGAFYSQQGCRFSDFEQKEKDVMVSTDQYREKFDYVQLPLMVNQYVMEGLAIKVGVQFGFLVNARVSYNETNFTLKNDGTREVDSKLKTDVDVKDFRRQFDFSIPIGASYEYMNVVLDLRYHLGFCSTYKDKSLPKEKNRFFTFTVGYKL